MIIHPVASELAVQFFVRFSRLEYALKILEFRLPAPRNGVKPDWSRFSRLENIASLFPGFQVNPIANYLIQNPPKKRVLIDGNLDWQETPTPQNMDDLTIALSRVRNNLFHGDKTNPNLSRNIQLFTASLFIIDAMLAAHDEVRVAYEIGAENA